MGLQINTNVAALNAYRNLNGTQSSMQTSLERLSSGLRINRAADDAAGLAISEKLRSQVNGLNQAQANAQDGVSLIQTAEGALNEVHSILQRMRGLAVQSASDTNTDADRAQIQKEVAALNKEIDGIATRTQFNGMGLLDGNFQNKQLQIGANQQQTMGVSVAKMDSTGLGLANLGVLKVLGDAGSPVLTGDVPAGTFSFATATSGALQVKDSSGNVVGTADAAAKSITFNNGSTVTGLTAAPANGSSVSLSRQSFADGAGVAITTMKVNGPLSTGTYTISGTSVLDGSGKTVGSYDTTTFDVKFADGGTIDFTGAPANSAVTGKPTFTITDNASTTAAIDLSTQQGAVTSLRSIDLGISKVSDQRADLGAIQNRLSHTIANLGVASENLAASESRIRDTDMAKEMTNFSRSQILQQAGVSMLAQANQASQSVLKLLG